MGHPLLDIFERTCDERSARLAAADERIALNYADFRAVACGLASRISEATTCERVGIVAPTSTACAAAIFAAWYAGKVPVPLNFLLPPPELARVVADARLDTIIAADVFAPAIAATGVRTLPLDATTLAPGRCAPPSRGADDTCVMLYTSGTSGDPKGVCLSFDNVVQNALRSIEHARMHPDQVFLSVLPQFHSFGLTTLTVIPLLLGASVHYQARFSPAAVVQTIAAKRVSIFIAVASMYAALLRLKAAAPADLASLELLISGGEPLPMSVADAFEQRFGKPIMEGYGLTETSPVVSINMAWARRRGSVGTAIPGVQVRAVDAGGRALEPGREGELMIRGHCVMQGYFHRPDETAACIRDGWLHTGDVGRVDADGFIFITGRAKDMLIIGGENVYPREIEAVLEEHPAVAEAAVVGVPDALRGELPVAFVLLREGATADPTALREHCRERLAGFKVPRRVEIATELPRGPTGKILKRALRDRLREGSARA